MPSIFQRALNNVLPILDTPDETYRAVYHPTFDLPDPLICGSGTRNLCGRCLTLIYQVVLAFGQGIQLYRSEMAHSIFRLDASRSDYSANPDDKGIRLDGFLKKVYEPQICVICRNIKILFDNNKKRGTSNADVRITWTLQSVDPKICFRTKFPLSEIQVRIEAKQYRQYSITLGSFDLWKDGAVDVNGVVIQDNPVILPLDDLLEQQLTSSSSLKPEPDFMSTYGPSTRKMITSWMQECLENHSKCNSYLNLHPSTPENFVPGRLIYITGETAPDGNTITHIRLVEKSVPSDFSVSLTEYRIFYLSMSHCWGPPPDPHAPLQGRAKSVLNLANHSAWRTSIPLEDISPTALQAIMLCRSLGFDYIWIDSLCIIQDSLEDWQIESATMGDIYRFAYCNLAALWSFSDADGFLNSQRDPRVEFGFHTSLPEILGIQDPAFLRNSRGEECTLLYGRARLTWDFEPPHGGCGRGPVPLLSRAWVFQERQLARRMLAFTENTVYWSCNSGDRCENERWSTRPYILSALYKWQQRAVSFKAAMNCVTDRDLDAELTGETAKFWADCVVGYTACKLTKPQDRLIALSSIAKEVSAAGQMSRVKYLAGLWNFNLEDQLLWLGGKNSTPNREKAEIIPARRKIGDEDYTAPTWSWASTEAPISPGPFCPSDNHRKLAFVLSADVFLTTDFAYGLVSAGYVRLSARLLKISSLIFRSPTNPCVYDSQIPSGRINFAPDTSEDTETVQRDISNVRWVPVRMQFSKHSIDIKGLLIYDVTHSAVDEYKNKNEKLAAVIKSDDKVFKRLGYLNIGRTSQFIHGDELLLRELGGECGGIGEGGTFEQYLERFKVRGKEEFEEFVLI